MVAVVADRIKDPVVVDGFEKNWAFMSCTPKEPGLRLPIRPT